MKNPYTVRAASFDEDEHVCAVAKQSRFTKDFCSIMFVRQNIEKFYERGAVGVAVRGKEYLGFICAPDLIRKPHSSIYYVGVSEDSAQQGIGRALVRWALEKSPWGCVELICEERNEGAIAFYRAMQFKEIGRGFVGKKTPRPYLRLELRR